MNTLRWTHFPYCVERLDDGRYVILNRSYKPLGMTTRNHVDYEPWAVAVRMTKARARKLSWSGSEDTEVIYLYDNGCIPSVSAGDWVAYAKRLQYLSTWVRRGADEKDIEP